MTGIRNNTSKIAIVLVLLLAIFATASMPDAQARRRGRDTRSSQMLTPEKFTRLVVEIAEEDYADLDIKETDTPFVLKTKDGKISLENLYKNVRPIRNKTALRTEIESFLNIVKSSPSEIGNWNLVKDRIRPQIFPKDYLDNKLIKQKIVFKKLNFSNDLLEGYVIDSEKAFQYINKEHLKKWNINLEAIKKTAYDNLATASSETRLNPVSAKGREARGKYLVISVKDGYAAARLLLPEMRNKIESELGKPCFVAIPNRDFLVAWSYNFSKKKEFKRQVLRDFHYKDHPLSPEIFQIVNTKVEVHTQVDEDDDEESEINSEDDNES